MIDVEGLLKLFSPVLKIIALACLIIVGIGYFTGFISLGWIAPSFILSYFIFLLAFIFFTDNRDSFHSGNLFKIGIGIILGIFLSFFFFYFFI